MISKHLHKSIVTPGLRYKVENEIIRRLKPFIRERLDADLIGAMKLRIISYLAEETFMGRLPQEYGSYRLSFEDPLIPTLEYIPPLFKEDIEEQERLEEMYRKLREVKCSCCGCSCRYGD